MIEFCDMSMTYPDTQNPVLREVDLAVREGELALVVGRTGSGKSTLLRCINGLAPHFTGGYLAGSVSVAGRSTRDFPPREFADVVGFVQQDPMSGFVTDTVEEELAYGMETLGVPPQTMRRRVEEVLDLLGLATVRDRPLRTLSGGQRQRAAIGSVLTPNPAVLVLDEPTSALDPGAAEDVLAAIQRLVLDLGVTVVLAEHRLERVIQYADSVIIVGDDGRVAAGEPESMMEGAPVAPPVVQLGRRMGWHPLPLSVRDARRQTGSWRSSHPAPAGVAVWGNEARHPDGEHETPIAGHVLAEATDVVAMFGRIVALADISTQVRAGEVAALMGRNGSGKSTLLNCLVGIMRPAGGTVRVGTDAADPADLSGARLLRRIGLVPQEAGDLLYADSVEAECHGSDADAGAPAGTTRAVLDRICPGVDAATHPRDLSEGQRLSLVLAIILAAQPPVILLDEPTRGLDYESKARFGATLRDLADRGHAVLMATHDVELVAEAATRVIIIADGEIVADGPTPEVVVSSPIFAPQISKILRPRPILTVSQAVAALTAPGHSDG